MSRPKGGKELPTTFNWHLTMSDSDTFLIWTFPQVGESPFVGGARTCERRATYCVLTCTRAHTSAHERILLFRVRDANSCIVNITRGPSIHRSTMEPERGDSKSKRLRKRKAVIPHRPAKRPMLFQADQQETELRQRHTFRKWRHNLAIYYANSHGSCVNSAKPA